MIQVFVSEEIHFGEEAAEIFIKLFRIHTLRINRNKDVFLVKTTEWLNYNPKDRRQYKIIRRFYRDINFLIFTLAQLANMYEQEGIIGKAFESLRLANWLHISLFDETYLYSWTLILRDRLEEMEKEVKY